MISKWPKLKRLKTTCSQNSEFIISRASDMKIMRLIFTGFMISLRSSLMVNCISAEDFTNELAIRLNYATKSKRERNMDAHK